MGRYIQRMLGVVAVLLTLGLTGLSAAEISVGVEYIYPTEFDITPITGNATVGTTSPIIGGIVEPGGFETRYVGTRLVVEAAAARVGDSGLAAAARRWGNGDTPLMMAATAGDRAAVKALLAKGADVNVQNNSGATALMGACAGGYRDIVALLLEHNAYAGLVTRSGATALMFASKNGHVEVGRMLLAKGVDINMADRWGSTALTYAVDAGHANMVKMLAEKGADPTIQNKNGVTPLMLAAGKKDDGLVILLTRSGSRK